MRLIDAELFKKQVAAMAIKNGYAPEKANALCKLIDNQPTAYDIDQVLKELIEIKNTFLYAEDNSVNSICYETMRKAIAIVEETRLSE